MGSYSTDFPGAAGGASISSISYIELTTLSTVTDITSSGAGINATSSLLLPTFRTTESSSTEPNYMGAVTLTGSELTLTRGGGGNALTAVTQIIEFSSVTSNNFYSGSMSGGTATTDVTVTSVDTDKSITAYQGLIITDNTGINMDDVFLSVELINSTTVRVTRDAQAGAITFFFQVLEI